MKIWCFSDTHGQEDRLIVPDNVDMAIFAGDAGTVKDPKENAIVVRKFLEWYDSLKIKYKILVFGNHDTSVETGHIKRKDIPESLIYLRHEHAIVEGYKIFGSEYTPSYGNNWAYNVARHKLYDRWKDIPEDTDILITHGPPKSILDSTSNNATGGVNGNTPVLQCGCKALLKRVHEIKPKLHVFGHIHPEKGCSNAATLQLHGLRTRFVNACVFDMHFKKICDGTIIESSILTG